MKYFLFMLSLGVVGCVSQSTYYVELSPRYDVITEDFFRGSTYDVGGVEHFNYKVFDSGLRGAGGQISLVEISDDVLYARIGYFYTELSSKTFSYSVADSPAAPMPIDAEFSGLNIDLGFRIWHFIPHIFSRYTKFEFVDRPDLSVLLPNGSTSVSYAGAGMAIDIPLSKRFSLLLNGQFSEFSQTYTLGLMMGGWVREYPYAQKGRSKR